MNKSNIFTFFTELNKKIVKGKNIVCFCIPRLLGPINLNKSFFDAAIGTAVMCSISFSKE